MSRGSLYLTIGLSLLSLGACRAPDPLQPDQEESYRIDLPLRLPPLPGTGLGPGLFRRLEAKSDGEQAAEASLLAPGVRSLTDRSAPLPRLLPRRRASIRLRSRLAPELDGRWLRHRPQTDPWAPHEQPDAPLRFTRAGLQLWPDYSDRPSLMFGLGMQF